MTCVGLVYIVKVMETSEVLELLNDFERLIA